MFALTSIKGIGRRFANIVCKKADVDMNRRFFFLLPVTGNEPSCVNEILEEVGLREMNVCVFWFGGIFRAGELSAAELDNLMTIVANPRQFKIPDWFLNRQKDYNTPKLFPMRST